jgi:hypothetical protein
MYHQRAMPKLPDETPWAHRPVHTDYVPRHEPSLLERYLEKEASDTMPSTSTGADEQESADSDATQLYENPPEEKSVDTADENRSDHTQTPEKEENAVLFNKGTQALATETRGGVLRRAFSGMPSQSAVQQAILSSQLDAAARGDFETHGAQLQGASKRMEQTKTAHPLAHSEPTLMERVRGITGRH